MARRLDGSPVVVSVYNDKNEKGIQFGDSAARHSSFAQNGKLDGSDERQLYSRATKSAKKLLTALLC